MGQQIKKQPWNGAYAGSKVSCFPGPDLSYGSGIQVHVFTTTKTARTFVRAMLTTLLALAITAFLVEVARRLAPAVGLIDSPNERKAHEGDIPLVGGIAIFAGLLLVLSFKGMLVEHWAFFVAAALLGQDEGEVSE